jgi:hypothetical protein
MIELTTNSQGTLASAHFENKVEAYLASKNDKSEQILEQIMSNFFIVASL